MGILWNPTYSSFHSRQRVSLTTNYRVPIRFLLQQSWRPRIPKDQCSCLRVFWFCREQRRPILFRQCSVLWRSCWLRLLFRRSIALGGTIVCKFPIWLHLPQLALSQPSHILARVFRRRFLKRKSKKRRQSFRKSYLEDIVRLDQFRAPSKRVPNMRYRPVHLLILHELKLLLSSL